MYCKRANCCPLIHDFSFFIHSFICRHRKFFHGLMTALVWATLRVLIYSYFDKGCRKKCTRQSRRYCGWFWVHCSSKKFERMAREAMDICLRWLKESNKSRFDSYSVRNSELIVSHITFRDCRVHIFSDNLPRNSCISVNSQCNSLK